MANQLFAGFLYDDTGAALATKTVNLYARNTTAPVLATTATDVNGYWAISYASQGQFDVETVDGSSKRRRKYDTSEQLTALEVLNFRIRNPAATFKYDIVPAAIVADRQLNLPLLTATDTYAVLALAQTFLTGVKTFNSSILAVRNPADTFSYTIVGGAILADRNLSLPVLTGADTLMVLGLAQTVTGVLTLTTPLLGTPTSGVLTNCTGLPTAGLVDAAVTYAKIQNISASARVLGRITAAAGVTEELTGANLKTIIGAISLTADVSGILPTANGGTGIAYFTAAGPTVARVYTFPDAAATIARTDAAQTFTGVQTMTSPVINTGATGTGIGTGAGTLAAGDHTHAASGAVTRVGGNTTEATTTSTSAVDLITISSLNITAATPILLLVNLRKDATSAHHALVGWKLNATNLLNAKQWSTAVQQTDEAPNHVWLFPRVTNYVTNSGYVFSTSLRGTVSNSILNDNDAPTAAITSVIVIGQNQAGSTNTMGADEMQVYSYAIS